MVTFFKPLKQNHPAGDLVSPEFVRYRWWVDVDMGTVFWHDHAFGATTWPHGGFGVTIVEPFGSTYHDPKNGKLVYSGPIADIHSNEPIGAGVSGSFRELMVSIHDTVPHTVNVIEAGNPPGQPIEVALEAGKTVSFQMPDKIMNAPNQVHQRRDAYDRQRFQLPRGTVCTTLVQQSGYVKAVQQRDPWRSRHAALAGVHRRHHGVSSVASADERIARLDHLRPYLPHGTVCGRCQSEELDSRRDRRAV